MGSLLLIYYTIYPLEFDRFDTHWGHWDFSLTYSFWLHYGPRVNLASKKNQYHGYLLGVKATGARG
jgi:hypothetical protein